ncbi:MAG: type I restriction enzyme HsdR N-terminal domain-containing protein [Aulosira sp. ZfuVER01]|nr:type I restriction enzyme HsdR N-terminal domain-containing protein [Aulosira sp. ZfuVER01]MDZ7998831.1 type I restriction enzyme HsdR N-terminal domain-containing protein [Aulosira sp. DedVER01a]MDZ8055822.1 type I restriction enzyme HsdR N-terminal domain-containing protein [Aulosira sp. ZfuCHP01]
MNTFSEEISKTLHIYKRNCTEYTKCLIRRKEILLDGRPEEKVRQLFIYFLLNQSGLFPKTILIKVEANNHDIEIYKARENDNFKPYCPPIMIVEVKREEENLHNHEKQIERYLKQSCSQFGILYNYHQIIAYTNKDKVFSSTILKSLEDIPPLILESSNNLEKDTIEFEKAVNGNYDSFIYLANKYGRYKLNKIVFRLKDEQLPLSGSRFEFQDNKIHCYIYGKDNQKRQSFDYQKFDKLLSIIY